MPVLARLLIAAVMAAIMPPVASPLLAQAEVDDPTEMNLDVDHAEPGHDEAAASDGSINPVTVDPDLAIVTAIIFLLLLTVLGKFAWGPLVAAIDTREKTMSENIAEAQRSNEEARRLLADHEEKMAGAAAEVKQMLDQARKDADAQKQQILDQAQEAAQAEKNRAIKEIDAAKNVALRDLAERSVDTAVRLAGQIVHRQLTPEDRSQLVNDALQKLPSQN